MKCRCNRTILVLPDNSSMLMVEDTEIEFEHGCKLINLSNLKLAFLPASQCNKRRAASRSRQRCINRLGLVATTRSCWQSHTGPTRLHPSVPLLGLSAALRYFTLCAAAATMPRERPVCPVHTCGKLQRSLPELGEHLGSQHPGTRLTSSQLTHLQARYCQSCGQLKSATGQGHGCSSRQQQAASPVAPPVDPPRARCSQARSSSSS
jgi:hypothetical protein